MDYRLFGRTGVKVSPLCLGAMNFGHATDEADSIRIIHRALEAGINFIDTANVYNQGRSEEIVGKALLGRRQEVFLATKVHGTVGTGPNDQGVSRLHIFQAVEDSLRRLQTDCIDLYQVHRPRLEVPQDETLGALTDLVRAGKVRYVLAWDQMGWHEIVRGRQAGDRIRFCKVQPCIGTRNRIWTQMGGDLVVQELPLKKASPRLDSGAKFMHEAVIESGSIDMGAAPSMPKLVKDLTATIKNLNTAGREVYLDIQTDENVHTTTWTPTGVMLQP